jgi:hypothetical protein
MLYGLRFFQVFLNTILILECFRLISNFRFQYHRQKNVFVCGAKKLKQDCLKFSEQRTVKSEKHDRTTVHFLLFVINYQIEKIVSNLWRTHNERQF